jgi:HlyD family secretion protein
MLNSTMPQQEARHRGPAARVARFVWAHRWFAFAVVAALTLGGWQAARALLGPSVVVDQVRRGDLVQTVVASGHVETPFRVEIGAQITGVVSEVMVEEGQRVVQGQELVRLAAQEPRAAVVQAEGAVAQAEARLRQIAELTLPLARETLNQARATLRTAQASFDRTSELARHGNTTRVALDEAQRALDVARTQVNSAELQVYTASPGGSDEVLARTQLDQARANLDTARARLGYATISAPRDGVLISRNVERGTVVQPGRALMVLAPAGNVQLVLQIDERNLSLISLGQEALASADAYPDRKMAARVSYINPAIDIARASVEVKLTVPDPPPHLRQDMTVSVDIAVARREGALVLAARSVREAQAAQPWVMGLRNGRAFRRNVRIGLRGNGQVEIVDGIEEGAIGIPVNAGVVTGQRVRPVMP